ncbi:hypothetical protein FJT64_008476 [Amphibalanus amphitrite]|uniref:Uncharacterized protein n=1 Tax=Amphibalanus amphitrite TaxID=1232801 RepID=A0A6A4VSU4_AMPAM|nr:hypothetical protein FJT64_008476 [Amphibalanus amphitrite]
MSGRGDDSGDETSRFLAEVAAAERPHVKFSSEEQNGVNKQLSSERRTRKPGKESLPADWAARLSSAPPEKELRAWTMEPRLTEPWTTAGTGQPWASSLGLRGRRIWLPTAEPQRWPQPSPASPAGSESADGAGQRTADDAAGHHLEDSRGGGHHHHRLRSRSLSASSQDSFSSGQSRTLRRRLHPRTSGMIVFGGLTGL